MFRTLCKMGVTILSPTSQGSFTGRLALMAILLSACASRERDLVSQPQSPQYSASKEQLAMIDRIVRAVPAEERDTVRSVLMNYVRAYRNMDVSTLPRRPLTAEQEENRRSLFSSLSADTARPYVQVTVALVPTLRGSESRAEVVRLPQDGGRPLLLLREADATAQDLVSGLRTAAFAVREIGRAPGIHQNLAVRSGTGTPSAKVLTAAAAVLEMLRSTTARPVPGVGLVRAMDVMTPTFKKKP